MKDWSKEKFEDYPTRSTEDFPLHENRIGFDREGGDYWACERPEAEPIIEHICYDWRCTGCLIVAEAVVRTMGEQQMWWNYMLEDVGVVFVDEPTPLSWLFKRGWFWYYHEA